MNPWCVYTMPCSIIYLRILTCDFFAIQMVRNKKQISIPLTAISWRDFRRFSSTILFYVAAQCSPVCSVFETLYIDNNSFILHDIKWRTNSTLKDPNRDHLRKMQLQDLPAGNRTRVLCITRAASGLLDQWPLGYRSRCRQLGREFYKYINEMVILVKYKGILIIIFRNYTRRQ